MSTKIMTYGTAGINTVAEEMRRDPSIFFYLEYAAYGKMELMDEFGPERAAYAGIQETQMVGAGIGAALAGTRPIVYLHMSDFTLDAWGQIVDQAGMVRFKVAYELECPVVFWMGVAGANAATVHHSGYYANWMANTPGLITVIPSSPADVVGLWRNTLRNAKDPVCFLDQSGVTKGPVPDGDYIIPFGVADIKREGKDVTIAAVGNWVNVALSAAEDLAKEGIDAEVWDPRTLMPLDRESLIKSVRKTGAMVVVDQAPKSYGTTGEYIATVAEAITPVPPMARLATKDVPRGAASTLSGDYIYPTQGKIVEAVKAVLKRK
jgi:pyruvate dehydrogenase E1 component beta subunit